MPSPIDRLPRRVIRLVRAVIAPAWWALLILSCLLVSVAYHVEHPLTRIVARDLTNHYVSQLIIGRLEIGSVAVLDFEHVEAHDVSFYDGEGREVIHADEVELGFDLAAGLVGTLHFSYADLRHGDVNLLEGETALPSVIEAFSPPEPSTSEGPSLHAVVDDIHLDDVHMHGELLGLEGIEVPDLDATGRLEAHTDGVLEILVTGGTGTLTEPYPFVGRAQRLTARISTDPRQGVLLRTGGLIERPGTDGAPDGPTDHIAVRLTYKLPEGAADDDPQELDILVHADPAEAQVLSELGYEWADLFDSQVTGWFRLSGDPEGALAMHVNGETEGGPIHIRGTLGPNGNVSIHGRTEGLDLSRAVRGAPEIEVAGSGSLEIDGSDPDAPPRIAATLEPLLYDGWAVPALRGEGVLLEDRVRIDRVSAPYAGGTIRGSGEIGFDGSTDLRVRGTIPNLARDRNVRRVMPDLSGSATVDARIQTFGEDRPDLDFAGTIILRDVHYGELSARYLRLEGSARGDLAHPRLQIDADGEGVFLAGYELGTADLSVHGGPRTYGGNGRFRSSDGRSLELAANVTRNGRTWTLDANDFVYHYAGGTWAGNARDVVFDADHFIQVGRATLASNGQRLEGWGTYRFHGPDELSALLTDFDLAALRALIGDAVPDVGGRADALVELTGDVMTPVLHIEGALRDGHVKDLNEVNASYRIDYEEGDLNFDADMDLGARGSLHAVGSGLLNPGTPNPFDALGGGTYEMDIGIHGVDLEVVHELADTALPEGMTGRMQGQIHASGPLLAPNLDVQLGVYRLQMPGMSPLNVTANFSYETGALVGNIAAADERGPLARMETSLLIDLVNLLLNPAETMESMTTLPWTVDLTVPPRRLADFPPELRASIPSDLYPFQVDLSGRISGGGFETQGDLTLNAEWTGAAVHPICEAAAQTHLTAHASLSNAESTIETTFFDGDQELASVTIAANTPFEEWVTHPNDFAMPATRLSALLSDAPIEKLPYLCEYATGPMSATLEASDLFTDQPTLHVEAASNGAQVMETDPVRATFEVNADAESSHVLADFAWWSGESARFEVRAPIVWDAAHPVAESTDGDLLVRAVFDSAPLGPFVTWLPQIAFAHGYLSGSFEATGPLDDLDMQGDLSIHDGYVELVGLGQHLHDVQGDFDFRGNWARITRLRAYDGDGFIQVDGSVGFDGWFPARARVSLNSREFPVRSEGSVLATLTGSAGIDADISGDETDMDIEVRSLNVQLPEDSTRTVQDLDPHPDVRIIGVASRTLDEEEPYPFRIHVNAARPFWVRRSDFAAMIAADLVATYRDPDLFLSGYADLRRGFFEVFGKRFDIERGSMNFDGSSDIDPEVNLVATHDMRTPPNTQVTVVVSGQLSNPTIEFSSNHRDCNERASIISMLVSGRCGAPSGNTSNLQFNAYEQASDFLAGVAAGLLTLTARKEFGDVLPVIVIESGNQAFQSARVRAGFQANDIIPGFLKDVVQGAYIEGIFTAGNNSNGSGSSGLLPGVLIELSFPYSLVTTGQYTPPNNWSVDILWQP